MITRAIAKKYFGDQPALGQTLSTNQGIVTITGILEKLPDNTHLKGKGFAKIDIFLHLGTVAPTPFGIVYLKLQPGHSAKLLQRDLAVLLPPEESQQDIPAMPHLGHEAQTTHKTKRALATPLTGFNAVNISNRFASFRGRTVTILYTMTAFAALVLVISCINYINLSTSRSALRRREIAIRKTLGASGRWIFWQFMAETLIVTVIAVLAGIGLSELILPWLCNAIDENPASVGLLLPQLLGDITLLTLATALLAGIYPAVVMSRQQPARALADNVGKRSRVILRNLLIIAQFTASIVLISTTLTLYLQLDAWGQLDTGLNCDNTAEVTLNARPPLIDSLRRELESYPQILSSAPSMSLTTPPMEYQLDGFTLISYTEHYENMYARQLKQQLSPLLFFSVIALVISVVGIYSISSYTTHRRAREIALRKVMGAPSARIVGLLLWHFSRPVLAAVILAAPATWFGVNYQMSDFNSLIPWHWIAFVFTPLVALLIAWLTVSSHTLQVANSDPALALRCE